MQKLGMANRMRLRMRMDSQSQSHATFGRRLACPSNRGLFKLFSADGHDSKGAFGRRVNFSRFDAAVLNLS